MRSSRRTRLVLLSLLVAILVGTGAYGVALGGSPSKPATPDTKAPDVHVSFPDDHAVYNAGGWTSGCPAGGICGTAKDDGTGVASVVVAIQQVSTGLYWSGTSFSLVVPLFLSATGTTSWSYAFPAGEFPADGDYTALVEGIDFAGNTSNPTKGPASPTFTIDTTPPPPPDFKKIDTKPGHGTDAHFDYTDAEKGVKFHCQLDGGGYSDCGPHKDYHHLPPGGHTFCVVALDKAGNESAPTCYSWNVGAAQPYTMGGSAIGTLHPGGPAQPIDVSFQNDNSDVVRLTTLTVTVTGVDGGRGACSASDFQTTAYSGAPFDIPMDASDLTSIGIDQSQWPTIQMIDNGNQDGCIGATVHFDFTGTP